MHVSVVAIKIFLKWEMHLSPATCIYWLGFSILKRDVLQHTQGCYVGMMVRSAARTTRQT